jgi:hypothetical protein
MTAARRARCLAVADVVADDDLVVARSAHDQVVAGRAADIPDVPAVAMQDEAAIVEVAERVVAAVAGGRL